MARFTAVHWLAPASTLGALIAGIGIAIGHHLFYQYLAGKAAGTTTRITVLGSEISRQEISFATGTAFAYFTKACLLYAVAAASVQVFWREATANEAGPTLGSLDDISSAMDNLLVFRKLSLWRQYPLPLLVATLAWLIPIASIITPATLSTELALVSPAPIHSRYTPSLDFRSLDFVDQLRLSGSSFDGYGRYVYEGPSQAVLTTTNSVMAGGAVLPIESPAANSSWTLDFLGPSISCTPMNDDLRLQTRRNIASYISSYEASIWSGPTTNKQILFSYMGWYPQVDSSMTRGLPFSPSWAPTFQGGLFSNTLYLFAASQRLLETYDEAVHGGRASLPVFTELVANATILDPPAWLDGTMLECRLVNSSYEVAFNYTMGTQSVNILSSPINSNESVSTLSTLRGPGPHDNLTDTSCVPLGTDWTGDPHSMAARTGPCTFHSESLHTLSYQAVWHAFSRVLQGSMSTSYWNNEVKNSSITGTALLNTAELAFLRSDRRNNTLPTLQDVLSKAKSEAARGLTSPPHTVSGKPLANTLEEMFRNVTVSLMSSPSLQPNRLSQTAPPPAAVTMPTSHLVYTYSPRRFWVTNSISILFATIPVIIGFVTMLTNGASYSDNFSTIFLVARGSDISERILPDDLLGHDPLPKYLAEAEVTIRKRGVGQSANVAHLISPKPLDVPADLLPLRRHRLQKNVRGAAANGGVEEAVQGSSWASSRVTL